MKYLVGVANLFACFVLCSAGVSQGQDAQSSEPASGTKAGRSCALAGRVTSARAGTPVSRASIELSAVDGGTDSYADAQGRQLGISFRKDRAQYSVTSDEKGQFCFETVKSGQYRLSGRKRGFLETNYGATTPSETGVVVNVESQEHREITFSLVPQGTISGKVTDADGEPVDSGSVGAMLRLWVRGAFRNVPVRGVQPNDLGEFRLANLTPGTYYVVFQPSGGNNPDPDSKGEANNAARPVRTFYPAATALTLAVPVQVGVGEDVQDVDIRTQKIRTHRLRGKVLGDRRETDFGAMNISPEDQDATALVAGGGSVGPDHTFEFTDMAPGFYRITYLVTSGGIPSVTREVFQVGDKDVDDAVLSVAAPVSIHGSVRVEGVDQPHLSDVQLQLASIEALVAPNFSAQVQPTGSFVIEDVSAGKYLLRARVPPGMYLKSARYGPGDIVDKMFDVPGDGGDMEIVLRNGVAELDGTIEAPPQGSGLQNLTSGHFLLVPDSLAPDGSGVHFGNAEASGKFSVKELRPGHYRAYAFASIDPSAVQNPRVLKAIEPFGTDLDLEESAKASVVLHVIPSEQAELAFGRSGAQ